MKKTILIACVAGLTSCFSLKEPGYYIYELYQISNNSSQSVTLRFYQEDTLKTVYADIWEGSFLYNDKLEKKGWDKLWIGSFLSLNTGQTALLYRYYNPYNHPNASPNYFFYIGNSTSIGTSRFFSYLNHVVGDSITISVGEDSEQIYPIQNPELWETWYDEDQFIYYHFWRIE